LNRFIISNLIERHSSDEAALMNVSVYISEELSLSISFGMNGVSLMNCMSGERKFNPKATIKTPLIIDIKRLVFSPFAIAQMISEHTEIKIS